MTATAPARPIEFRNTTLGATVAVLQATEPPALADALHKMLGGMPDFFNGEVVILDFGSVPALPERIDWAGLQSLLRRYRLQPIGVSHLPDDHHAAARLAGLAVLDASQLRDKPGAPAQAPARAATAAAAVPAAAGAAAPAASAATAAAQAATLFIDRPLRSGQQVYARGGDLVLLNGVSPGAEVIADGSIHCYGPLRGRAIAGAAGNKDARILSANFGPELVAIAGVYRTFERGIPESLAGNATLVRLSDKDQSLHLETFQLD